MEDNQRREAPGQLNPGVHDQSGNEVQIKKNESISDQGNEWSDKEGLNIPGSEILGEKAGKYIKDSADIEDLPDEGDEKEAEEVIKEGNAKVVDDDDGEDEDEVIEDPDDYVPGYDLGRNKVQ